MWPFQETTGYIADSFDHRDVWLDEVLGSDNEIAIPPKYRIEGLQYEYQGKYPFCVSMACTTLTEWKYGQKLNLKLSQPHLFFHAGGSTSGSSFRQNLDVLKANGALHYDAMPIPSDFPSDWHTTLKAKAKSIPFKDTTKILGYAKINTDSESLKRAIMEHGPILIGVNAGGTYYSGDAKRTKGYDNHAVLLVGWTATHWIIFDSLAWVKKTDGYGTLGKDYTFISAYVVTELPGNWKAKRDEARVIAPGALQHYGKRRNLEAEIKAANDLLAALKSYNNQSVLEAAGRFWTTMTNAIAYGGYTVTDCVNNTYYWRRTGEHIFNFDQEKV